MKTTKIISENVKIFADCFFCNCLNICLGCLSSVQVHDYFFIRTLKLNEIFGQVINASSKRIAQRKVVYDES